MQTQNYEEARRYFLNNARHGWKYIESFIVSKKMFERILKDDFLREAVNQIGKYADSRKLPRTNVRIKGYPIIVSSGYTLTYGVIVLLYEDKYGEGVMKLLMKNILSTISLNK